MKLGLFLVVALLTLSLPCIELPECAGAYDDVSNDFIAQSQVQTPICPPSVQVQHSAATHLEQGTVTNVFSSLLRSAPLPRPGRSVLDLISIQKK
jgi:hypothetical protein